MIKKITKSITFFQELFSTIFTFNSQIPVEVLLMLASGHIFEIFTPNQSAQTLGIDLTRFPITFDSW